MNPTNAPRPRTGGYTENGPRNIEVMERAIARRRAEDGFKVVLVETVRTTRADRHMRDSPECSKALTMYENDVRTHAETWGVPYLDITAEAELAPGEFIDTSHIWDTDAAKRYTRVLAAHLAAFMKNPQTGREG